MSFRLDYCKQIEQLSPRLDMVPHLLIRTEYEFWFKDRGVLQSPNLIQSPSLEHQNDIFGYISE